MPDPANLAIAGDVLREELLELVDLGEWAILRQVMGTWPAGREA
jgi:hypothetical protein